MLFALNLYDVLDSIFLKCSFCFFAGQSSFSTISDISVSVKLLCLSILRRSCQHWILQSRPHKYTNGHTSMRPSHRTPYQQIATLHG